jgi:hypothetical protein
VFFDGRTDLGARPESFSMASWQASSQSKRPRPAVWPFLRVIGLRGCVGEVGCAWISTISGPIRVVTSLSPVPTEAMCGRQPERSASAISCSRTTCFGQERSRDGSIDPPKSPQQTPLLSRTCCGLCADWWSFDEMATGLPFPDQSPYCRASTCVVESGRQKAQGTDGSRWPTADSIETTNRPFPGRVGDRLNPAPATADGRRTGEEVPYRPRHVSHGWDKMRVSHDLAR